MKRKSLGIGLVMIVILAAASVVTLSALGGKVGAADNVEINRPPIDPGGECICPQNYDPVVCRAGDGSAHVFSNLCVAHCSGYTRCVRYVPAPGE